MKLILALALALALTACGGNNDDMVVAETPIVKPPPVDCATNPEACK